MPTRKAQAQWSGDLKRGRGTMKFGSFEGPYSFSSRFENGEGTNPEGLLGAAHAGCFSMALSNMLAMVGHVPDSLKTTAQVTIEMLADDFEITRIALECEAKVPGIDRALFQKIADDAKNGCPVSKALASVSEITLVARLV